MDPLRLTFLLLYGSLALVAFFLVLVAMFPAASVARRPSPRACRCGRLWWAQSI